MTSIDPPVCIALDVPTLDEARTIARELAGTIRLFKIGYELFFAEGPRAVQAIRDEGVDVFCDFKVHDIPRTAAAAVREAARMHAAFVTIHGSGGREMIRACVETSREHGGPRILTVTVLTSLGHEDLNEIGIPDKAREQALRIGALAAEEGSDGLVLSPRELGVVRVAVPDLLLVTPGVRPGGSGVDDHRRALSPSEAISAGADLIVVGRPILQASDRLAAAIALVDEVRRAEAQHESRRQRDVDASISDVEDAEFVEEGDPA